MPNPTEQHLSEELLHALRERIVTPELVPAWMQPLDIRYYTPPPPPREIQRRPNRAGGARGIYLRALGHGCPALSVHRGCAPRIA
jgi:hypothetical protein